MPQQSSLSNRRNRRNNRGNKSSNKSSNSRLSSTNDVLKQLEIEYDPPFVLGKKWEPKKQYKVKVQHPHLPGQFDTVQFPMIAEETTMSDRAQFNDILVDLQDAVGFDGANGNLLYYNYGRCLEGQSSVDWKEILADRDNQPAPAAEGDEPIDPNNARDADNFSVDVDTWITYHESRDFAELLQNQRAYMNRLVKPKKTSPIDFKGQILVINRLIPSIPDTPDNSQFDDDTVKSLFLYAMPKPWRKRFKEVGKKLATENIDTMSQFFDVYFKEEPQESRNNRNNNNNHQNNNRQGNPRPNDPCPKHNGAHLWKECWDNPDGNNYRPRNNNGNNNNRNGNRNGNRNSNYNNRNSNRNHNNNNRGDQHNHEEGQSSAAASSSGGTSKSESTNDNAEPSPYDSYMAIDMPKDPNVIDLVPKTKVYAESACDPGYDHIFRKVLLDSGGTRSCIARSALPTAWKLQKFDSPYRVMTNNGVATHEHKVSIQTLVLPELNSTVDIHDVDFFIYEASESPSYDMIIGRDIMDKLGIDLKFSTNTIEWDRCSIPFTPRNETVDRPDQYPSNNPNQLSSEVEVHSHLPSAHFISDTPAPSPTEDPITSFDIIEAYSQQEMPFSAAIPVESPRFVYDLHPTPDAFATDIKESDYDTLNDGSGIAQMQDHLSDIQKNQLAKVLNQFNDMFILAPTPTKRSTLN